MSNRRAAALNSKAWVRAARVEAWTQQGGLCCFCRSVLTRALVTADHRRPRSKGGTDDPRNIQAACAFCNKAKGNMSDSAFLNLLKRRPPGLPPLILFCSIVRAINLRVERAVNRIARFAR